MLPTTLYIHIPWCIQKCPYCDFNSHRKPETWQEDPYIDKLLADLKQDILRFGVRQIDAIFLGGGTPSLLSGQAIHRLLKGVAQQLPLTQNLEITMEANPGTAEQQRFLMYRQAGVNRLSLGIQSFCPQQLKNLGRIHNAEEAYKAIDMARSAGFDNLNLDIMHGLPNQTLEQGLDDLKKAIAFQPNHISWYQLTLEPNTLFYKKPPNLPSDDACAVIEEMGFHLLSQQGYHRYEISAFAKPGRPSQHNLNYWTFGDYFGIGAGAHGKLTSLDGTTIVRTQKKRQPNDYLKAAVETLAQSHSLEQADILFEFMLNTSRLQQPIPLALFAERTGLEISLLKEGLDSASSKGLIHFQDDHWQITELGRRFTNDLQSLFLPS
ncbi:radical SAM family heme chaperone HemW [Legionella sp. W05-934-2]|uniref:radical SAM family heme chaperone HemW n=1 Tax=Legionella sp. W05-934-2 TaxID=1198649 RepID=UPI003461D04F